MHFVIDGNNVAFFRKKARNAELQGLLVVIQRLQQLGSVFPVVSSMLKYRIDDPQSLKASISKREVLETPPNTDSDRFILELATQLDAFLVSNDQYKEYKDLYSSAIDRRLPFMLVKSPTGEIMAIMPWIHRITEGNMENFPTKDVKETIKGST